MVLHVHYRSTDESDLRKEADEFTWSSNDRIDVFGKHNINKLGENRE